MLVSVMILPFSLTVKAKPGFAAAVNEKKAESYYLVPIT